MDMRSGILNVKVFMGRVIDTKSEHFSSNMAENFFD
jgi:hypothetical protein